MVLKVRRQSIRQDSRYERNYARTGRLIRIKKKESNKGYKRMCMRVATTKIIRMTAKIGIIEMDIKKYIIDRKIKVKPVRIPKEENKRGSINFLCIRITEKMAGEAFYGKQPAM